MTDFKCKYCGRVFGSRLALVLHERERRKRRRCPPEKPKKRKNYGVYKKDFQKATRDEENRWTVEEDVGDFT